MVENMSDRLAWFPKLGREDTEPALEFINVHICTLEPEKMQMWQNYYSKHLSILSSMLFLSRLKYYYINAMMVSTCYIIHSCAV